MNDGDSITEGHDCYPYAYAGQDITKIPDAELSQGPRTFVFRKSDALSTYNGLNRAVSGSRLSDAIARADDLDSFLAVDRNAPYPLQSASRSLQWAPHSRRIYILTVMFSNPNTLDGNVYATQMAAYVAARKNAGWDRVLLGTILPRGDNPVNNYNANYQTPYNNTILDSAWQIANKVDGVFNFAGQPIMGNPANNNDPILYQDAPIGVHPTTFAQATYLAPIYGAAVEAAIATYG